MKKKNIKNENITESAFDSLDEQQEKSKLIIYIFYGIFILAGIGITVSYFLPAEKKSIVLQECNCSVNSSSYNIPISLPNITKLLPDSQCNDFCYVRACTFGCSNWINHGLMNGKCICELNDCHITPSEINESS